MIKLTKLTCLFWCITMVSIAQQPETASYSFTLEEAITFALENNYKAINSRREVAKAIKRKWEVYSSGFPQINANIDYQNQLKQPVSLLPANAFDNTENVISTVEDFFGLTANSVPEINNGFIPVVFGTKQQLGASATLSQLIFDGSYLVGIEAAKTFIAYNDNLQEKTKLEVRKGVINAYGSVLVAQESVLILERNKETLNKIYLGTKETFKNGMTEEENVQQLEITLLQVTNQLNNAKRLAKIALQMFNLSIGADVDSNTILSDTLEGTALKNIDNTLPLKPFILEENIDYRIAYFFTEQTRQQLKLERTKALPSLTAFVNYGTQANSNSFTFFESDQQWFQSSILGVNLNIPIFSSLGRSAKTKQAKIAHEQANTEFLETQQNIKLHYNTAVSNYQLALENFESNKKNLALAESIDTKNQIKFTEGLISSFDLRLAQIQLYTVQQNVLQSMLDIIAKKAELETILNLPNK